MLSISKPSCKGKFIRNFYLQKFKKREINKIEKKRNLPLFLHKA